MLVFSNMIALYVKFHSLVTTAAEMLLRLLSYPVTVYEYSALDNWFECFPEWDNKQYRSGRKKMTIQNLTLHLMPDRHILPDIKFQKQ